jgi:glucose-1-phosphate thymidylyltransferase
MLGDNIFYGHGLPAQLQRASQLTEGAVIFAYSVKDPERYGVVEFDKYNNATKIDEKPLAPKSNYAVPGIYFYDNQVVKIAENLKPSARGELEITDINNAYIAQGKMKVEVIGRGTAWLDAGTHEALLQASNFVQAIQERQGILIASPEEVAYRMGYIDYEQLQSLAAKLSSSQYGQYLLNIPEMP